MRPSEGRRLKKNNVMQQINASHRNDGRTVARFVQHNGDAFWRHDFLLHSNHKVLIFPRLLSFISIISQQACWWSIKTRLGLFSAPGSLFYFPSSCCALPSNATKLGRRDVWICIYVTLCPYLNCIEMSWLKNTLHGANIVFAGRCACVRAGGNLRFPALLIFW